MKTNKLFLSVVFPVLTVFLFLSEPSSAQSKSLKQESLIVGEWFPLNTSKGGLGAGFTFNEDGNFIASFGAYIAFKYKLEGDTLIFILPGAKEVKQKVEIKSTKIIIGTNEQNSELIRIAGDNNAGIIGKWTGDHYTGRKQIMDFTTSQKVYLSVPALTQKGTYEISDDIVELIGELKSSFQWSVIGDSLTLKSIGGIDNETSAKYVKMKY